uniref:Myelin regulatory factor-like n=1 Tax=Saccoglossus kowalevskii TaxID=10224 RepID=A0ABM0M6X5_SACKO|nr:PREDICTED: myelin regulatory factor-like [Saccoglossus kowalevskii]
MDVIDENEALNAVLAGAIDPDFDFQQLEDFITKDEPEVYFPDITNPVPVNNTPSLNILPKYAPQQVNNLNKQNVDNYMKNISLHDNTDYLQRFQESLPESPPDSSSEPYSPPEMKSNLSNGTVHLSPRHSQTEVTQPSLSIQGNQVIQTQPTTHSLGQPPPPQMHNQQLLQPMMQVGRTPNSLTNYITPNPPQLSHLPTTQAQQGLLHDSYVHQNKKRKHSDSPTSTMTNNTLAPGLLPAMIQIKQEPGIYSDCSLEYDSESRMYMENSYQCIKWQAFNQSNYVTLVDATGKDLPATTYKTEADKGFNFSVPDDSFVCQKKNHFQVTSHIGLIGNPKYIRVDGELKPIDSFYLHLFGVKVESTESVIKVEQSQSDRSKKPFYPVKVDLPPDQVTKVTVGRLHFSETTSNNMRKKGKPNPDQRYFMLVVGLHAHCGNENYTIASSSSERIIVRASNPGQFENDVDMMWQKGITPDSVFHVGRVGINTDRPEESLVVHGDIKVTGQVLQPSDERVKENIEDVDTKEQLRKVAKLRLVSYDYIPEYIAHSGMSEQNSKTTGVLAQDLRDVMPDAVKESGDVILPNGHRIDKFLIVNKDRIYMENVGAVKELCKLTDNLENRIDELEKMNRKLSKLKRLDSLKSTSSGGTIPSRSGSKRGGSNVPGFGHKKQRTSSQHHHDHVHPEDIGCLSQKFMQGVIMALILIMLFCVAAMITLYALEATSGEETSSVVTTATYTTNWPFGNPPFKTNLPPVVENHTPTMMITTPCTGIGCATYCCEMPSISKTFIITSSPSTLPLTEPHNINNVGQWSPELSVNPTTVSVADQIFNDGQIVIEGEEYIKDNKNENEDVNNRAIIYKPSENNNRKKRSDSTNKPEPPLAVTSIRIIDGNYLINDSHCDYSHCGNGNFSYTIKVPAYFPLKWTELELNVSGSSLLWLCKYTHSTTCLDAVNEPAEVHVPGHQTSTWSSTNCETQDGSYVDYHINFKRDLSLCSTHSSMMP